MVTQHFNHLQSSCHFYFAWFLGGVVTAGGWNWRTVRSRTFCERARVLMGLQRSLQSDSVGQVVWHVSCGLKGRETRSSSPLLRTETSTYPRSKP